MMLITAIAMALALAAAAPALAGMPAGGGMMGGQGHHGDMMGGGMMGGDHERGRRDHRGRDMGHEGALISVMLAHGEELGLSAEQQQKLRDLRTEATKDWIRRTADVRVAELELDALLEREAWDVAAIEAKAKQIAALTGERRVARLKALAAGRAVLAPDQLRRLAEVGHRGQRGGGAGPGGPGMGPVRPGMPGPGAGRGPGGPPTQANPHH
jgi:Spy/CpxP family protein refolding chaperone